MFAAFTFLVLRHLTSHLTAISAVGVFVVAWCLPFSIVFSIVKVWSYLYTTAGDAVKTSYLANGGNSPSKPPPLAGLGYGLPLR